MSLGIFAWARLEPRPGEYDFDWLDRLMDLLHAHGVAVNLATPTAAPPSFTNPSQRLDWMRFNSDSWIACFEEQKTILGKLTPHVPVTTNLMSFHKSVDYQ